MRVALYARYSSDQQRAASIADQQRTCREFAARQGWNVVADYTDAAMSGASLMRPGFQSLMRAALAGTFDVVLAESLDRFSRDQEDTAGLFKRLTFAGVRIVTVSEGDIGHLHVGLKGTMNALYLQDLAEKTRRGLRGRVEAGRSGGGICYGYRVVRVLEGQPRGEREIHPEEAAIVQTDLPGVRRRRLAEGDRQDAERRRDRRADGRGVEPEHDSRTRGPRHRHPEQRAVYRTTDLEPSAVREGPGHRQAAGADRTRPTPGSSADVPHLRILDDDLWQAAKARQAATRLTMKAGIVRARRPKYLVFGADAVRDLRRRIRPVLARSADLLQRALAGHLHEPPQHQADRRRGASAAGDARAVLRARRLRGLLRGVHGRDATRQRREHSPKWPAHGVSSRASSDAKKRS